MSKQSAGILLFRRRGNCLEVLLVHPGGPFYSKKDLGDWSIPKGEFGDENALDAAKREVLEEIGITIADDNTIIPLSPLKQKSRKTIFAWAIEGDFDVSHFSSNLFPIEWPPKSGKFQQFPEVDKAEWFNVEEALEKIHKGQIGFIHELVEKLG